MDRGVYANSGALGCSDYPLCVLLPGLVSPQPRGAVGALLWPLPLWATRGSPVSWEKLGECGAGFGLVSGDSWAPPSAGLGRGSPASQASGSLMWLVLLWTFVLLFVFLFLLRINSWEPDYCSIQRVLLISGPVVVVLVRMLLHSPRLRSPHPSAPQ